MDQLTTNVLKIPREIQRLICSFTFLMQMQAAFSTNDLEEMARYVYRYASGREPIAQLCWLTTLLDLGIRIPDPPLSNGFFERKEDAGWTPFHVAAITGDIALIRRLVRLGYEIDTVDSSGDTALYEVARGMHYPPPLCLKFFVLRVLCEEGANVNIVFARDDSVIQALISSRSRHFSANSYYESIYIRSLKLLLEHGASLNGALHAVAETESCVPFIQVLLDAGADLEAIWHDKTPLTMAAFKKNPKAVRALIDAGANVNGAEASPLFAAIKQYRDHYVYHPSTAAVLRILCDAGADTKHLNKSNHSILSFALLTSGGSTKRFDTWDTVPKVVKVLCQGGSDVNIRHHRISEWSRVEDGDTPLHIATHASPGASTETTFASRDLKAPSECLEILISYGADINAQNDAGRTPLHSAVLHASLLCVQVLLQHGADLDIEDLSGKTALMLARDMDLSGKGGDYPKIVALLEGAQQTRVG